jgi:hypothetical protein
MNARPFSFPCADTDRDVSLSEITTLVQAIKALGNPAQLWKFARIAEFPKGLSPLCRY